MEVTYRGEVHVVVRLTEAERFKVDGPYGNRLRPVMIDVVKAKAMVTRGFVTGSGYRVNKDGTVGSLRAAYVPIPMADVPEPIRQAVLEAYTKAALADPATVWR